MQAGLLANTPIDEFDGQPLRWRRTADGLVIYSIGPPGKYEGDALDENREWSGEVRVEFRLWDPDRRGLPAPPRPEADAR